MVEVAPAPVVEPVTAVAVEPAPVAAAEVTTAPAPVAATPAPKLDDMLAEAGLQLAATDPEKLRAAQAAAAQAATPVRVGRARKPVVVPVDEPLVQVDTSRQ